MGRESVEIAKRAIEAFNRVDIELFTALSHSGMPQRGWTAFMGVLSIVAGIIVVAYPGLTLVTLAVILGIWLLIFGVMEIALSWRLRSVR